MYLRLYLKQPENGMHHEFSVLEWVKIIEAGVSYIGSWQRLKDLEIDLGLGTWDRFTLSQVQNRVTGEKFVSPVTTGPLCIRE